jgi:DNA repair protein REV1
MHACMHRYMALKNSKLREQFEAKSLENSRHKLSDLFAGVGIFINGLTTPSNLELKQIMMLHGGRFENYLVREHVTHIVCSHLPDTKLKQLRKSM